MDNAITEAVNAITEEAIPSMSKINMSAIIIRATDITFINIAIIVLSFFHSLFYIVAALYSK